ncbi:hypothetical protein Pmani_031320 [Petrolisthes manimaculis]|uniref:Uncharacterized protein n=1 Tax=Petrolisthes manimaculis TaxID=1843537 RepID=A0AAE1NVE6_9EUCA|nr:hypothetical protein Pmani_031320 [Petrolisthes manimaculis]
MGLPGRGTAGEAPVWDTGVDPSRHAPPCPAPLHSLCRPAWWQECRRRRPHVLPLLALPAPHGPTITPLDPTPQQQPPPCRAHTCCCTSPHLYHTCHNATLTNSLQHYYVYSQLSHTQ